MTAREKKAAIYRAWYEANSEKVAARGRAWYKANSEKVAARGRAWYKANSEKVAARNKAWHEANSEKVAARNKACRGAKQEALAGRPKPEACEICGDTDKRICWDHCHNSGKFRGWICAPCNIALGMVRDSPYRLRALAAYLEANDSTIQVAA